MVDYINIILQTLLYISGFVIFGLIVFLMIKQSQFKHKVIIKSVVNGVKINRYDKFRIKKDKQSGETYWVFKKSKHVLPPFPEEAVEVDAKGKYHIVCYDIEGSIIPTTDPFDLKNKNERQELIKAVRPLTTSQRSFLVNQSMKAVRGKKNTIGELITMAAPYLMMLLIVVCFMIFFGEVVKPAQELGEQVKASQQLSADAAQANADAINRMVDFLLRHQHQCLV